MRFRRTLRNTPRTHVLATRLMMVAGLAVATGSLSAQADVRSLVRITATEGLSHENLRAILQDTRGFMWFGTFGGGLNRFDGYTVTTYRHDPADSSSLGGDFVRAIYEDRGARLWIGTTGGGLNRYDPDADRFVQYVHDPNNPRSLASDSVRAFAETPDGTLWIGTASGVSVLRPGEAHFNTYLRGKANVFGLGVDPTGALWVGSYGEGVTRLWPGTGRVQTFRHDPDEPGSLDSDLVMDLVVGDEGTVWVATWDAGLARFDRQSEEFTTYRHDSLDGGGRARDELWSLHHDDHGILWVGTRTGVEAFDTSAHEWLSPPANLGIGVTAVFRDREGLLWWGTQGRGAAAIDPAPPVAAVLPGSDDQILSGVDVRAVTTAPGATWIGTVNRGLTRIDDATGRVTRYMADRLDPAAISSNAISSLVPAPDGTVWIGTTNGLNVFDPRTERFTRVPRGGADASRPDTVFAMAEGSGDEIWVLTTSGLFCVDRRTRGWSPAWIPDRRIQLHPYTAVQRDGIGSLWIIEYGARITRYDPATGVAASMVFEGVEPNRVNAVFQDSQGIFWVAARDGIFRVDAAAFARHSYELPLQVALTYHADGWEPLSGIEDRNGDLWFGADRGVIRWTRSTQRFDRFGPADGVASGRANPKATHVATSDRLFFGAAGGVFSFYPDSVSHDYVPPPVVVTDVRVDDRSLSGVGDGRPGRSRSAARELTHRNRILTFEFAALSYRDPTMNRYRYRLDPLEESFREVGADGRRVTYTNLAPGSYTFEVTGSNSRGVWNEKAAVVSVVVARAPWMTWWFRGAAGSALIAIAIGGHLARTRAANRRNAMLRAEIGKREAAQQALDGELRFERWLGDISKTLINLPGEEIPATIDELLRGLMDQTDTDRAGVIRSHGDGILRLSNVVTGSDMPDDPDLVGMDVTHFRHVCQRILNGEDVIIDEAHPLPADADAERRMYETRGLNATVIVPVMADGSLAAAVVLDVVGRQHTWTREQAEHARLTGQVMLQALQRARALDESQRQAAAASSREEQLRLLADGLPALIAYLDAEQRVVFSNKHMCDWLGVSADTIHGRPIRSVLGARRYEATHVAVEEALGGVTAGFTTALARGDGTIRQIVGTCVPHRDGAGRIAGCFALVQDVTERVRTDEELRRQRAELAHVARVMTLGHLSTTIAHELNQPLAAIVSNAQAAQRFLSGPRRDDAEIAEALTEIAEDGKRAGAVIHQMRALLRKEDPELGRVNVNQVIRDVLRLLEPDLVAKRIVVEATLDPGLPSVTGNAVQLQQVVMNLANNAADAMEARGGERMLIVTTADLGDESVEVRVRDTGPGIPADALDHLFEPFFTTSPEGMGMGLSIIETIVEAHGGRMSAANADDGGAIFQITLPAMTTSDE